VSDDRSATSESGPRGSKSIRAVHRSGSRLSLGDIHYSLVLHILSHFNSYVNLLLLLPNLALLLSLLPNPPPSPLRRHVVGDNDYYLKILRAGVNHNWLRLTATPKNIYMIHCFFGQRRAISSSTLRFCVRIAYPMRRVIYGHFIFSTEQKYLLSYYLL